MEYLLARALIEGNTGLTLENYQWLLDRFNFLNLDPGVLRRIQAQAPPGINIDPLSEREIMELRQRVRGAGEYLRVSVRGLPERCYVLTPSRKPIQVIPCPAIRTQNVILSRKTRKSNASRRR